MTRPRIATIVGSLRKDSINGRIARAIGILAADRLDCSLVAIGDLPLFDEDREREPNPAVQQFRGAVAAADGVLFVTPEYNRGIPGVLKNAIDIGSRPYGESVWDQKPAAVISASPGAIGGFGANHQLRQTCVFLNMPMMQQPEAYLGHVTDRSFDAAGGLSAGPLRELVAGLATAFADWVDLIHRGRNTLAEDPAHRRA